MALPVWVSNLVAYGLQIAVVAAAGTLLAHLFRLRHPRVTLPYWQFLLLACLALPAMQPWERPVLGPAISVALPADARIPGGAIPATAAPQLPWELLGAALAAGILLRLAWILLGLFRLHRFERKARACTESPAPVRDAQHRTGVRVPLLLSGEVDGPVTFGFSSPKIILPLSFLALSEPMQEAVLCHELLHVRRRDWVLIVAEELVGAVFWFHPAVRWLLNRIRLSREQTVDREVVRLTGNRQPYLDALLEFARTRGRPGAVPAPLLLRERHLVQRVALLLKEVSMTTPRLVVSIACVCLLLAGTVHLASGWFPFTGPPAAAPQEAGAGGREAKRPFLRIDGDVQESMLIHRVDPVYPEPALRARLSGIVKLRVSVDEDGQVFGIEPQAGHPLFTPAAVEAVRQWRYRPTLLNGAPVAVETVVTCVFSLEGNTDSMKGRNRDSGEAERPAIAARPAIPANAHVTVTASRGQDAPPAADADSGPQVRAPLNGPLRVGGNVQESKLVHRVAPVYPERAIREGIEGIVLLLVTVNEEGFVYELRAAQENNPILEAAAIDAVKEWHYSPTLLNGTPVPVQAMVTVVFNLK